MLEFTVDGQILRAKREYILATQAQNFPTVKFEFNEDWTGFAKTALFIGDSSTYSVVLSNDTCAVPYEVLTGTGLQVSVFGTKTANSVTTRITTNTVELILTDSGYAVGATPAEPTPTVYEQIMTALSGKQDILTIDTAMSDSSENVVKNEVIKAYVDSGLSAKADTSTVNAALSAKLNISDIDLSLSSNSTNPVQNRTVTNKISEIADVLDTKINVSTETGTAQAELSISSDYTKMGFVYMIPYTAFDNNSQIVTIPDDQDYAQQNAWVLYLKNRQFFMSDWDNKLWTRRYETNTWTQWTQI